MKMKTLRRYIVGALVAIAFSVLAANAGGPASQPIAIHVYPAGKFFTPEGVPALKGYYCLGGIGVDGTPQAHCAPAPRLI